MPKVFVRNRKKFLKQMEDNSLLIMFAGEEVPKRGDEFFPFTPKRNFYYMTGLDQPRLIFTLHKKEDGTFTETLFLEPFDPVQSKWVGAALSPEDAEKLSGIKNKNYIASFHSTIMRFIFANEIQKVYMDLENRYWDSSLSEDVAFGNELKQKFPYVSVENAYYLFARQRMIKSKEEIKNIQKAIDITREGLELMMKKAKPGMREYEIEAYFDFVLKRSGVKDRAFATIAASGKNAAILHYVSNDAKTGKDDLILFDLGAQVGYYSADITRTFPVSGKFTERQKTIYNIVLGGQKKVIESIKPGIEFHSLNDTLRDYYCKELKKIGLIESKEDLDKYYYHGVSHMLGLETHDIGRNREGKLEKGMVITVEPGLYIEEEGIGIRIEDDVLVTDKGYEVLSKDIIKTVADIEAFMQG